MCRRINKNNRGSLTVEACLTLPVFLCFFLLLTFYIKTACINITLNHAVNETTKQLAAACYPITFLNELEDETTGESLDYKIPSFSDEMKNVGKYISGGTEDIFSKFFSGEMGEDEIDNVLNSVSGSIFSDYKKGIGGYLTGMYAGKYYEIKAKAKYLAAGYLMDKFCESSFIDMDNIKYLLVELPQGDAEYETKCKDSCYQKTCIDIGFTPGQDDVVIAVEYKALLSLPFFGNKDVVTRHIAVEKAWLHGSNDIIYALDDTSNGTDNDSSSEGNGNGEGSFDENDQNNSNTDIVYVTKTGKKYHKSGCKYLSESKIPIKLSDAINRRYEPCKVCVTMTAKPFPGTR